jgi:hypothetical protein
LTAEEFENLDVGFGNIFDDRAGSKRTCRIEKALQLIARFGGLAASRTGERSGCLCSCIGYVFDVFDHAVVGFAAVSVLRMMFVG